MRTARLLTVVVGCVQGGVCVQGVGVCPEAHALAPEADTHPVDRQTPVKTLPCPKLRLRAVTTLFKYEAPFNKVVQESSPCTTKLLAPSLVV